MIQQRCRNCDKPRQEHINTLYCDATGKKEFYPWPLSATMNQYDPSNPQQEFERVVGSGTTAKRCPSPPYTFNTGGFAHGIGRWFRSLKRSKKIRLPK